MFPESGDDSVSPCRPGGQGQGQCQPELPLCMLWPQNFNDLGRECPFFPARRQRPSLLPPNCPGARDSGRGQPRGSAPASPPAACGCGIFTLCQFPSPNGAVWHRCLRTHVRSPKSPGFVSLCCSYSVGLGNPGLAQGPSGSSAGGGHHPGVASPRGVGWAVTVFAHKQPWSRWAGPLLFTEAGALQLESQGAAKGHSRLQDSPLIL